MEIDYSDNLKWEMVERTTKYSSGLDGNMRKAVILTYYCVGVDIIAIIETQLIPQIVLISQFRPPLDAHCLEFPAGLITEDSETPISAALRELQEETGYHGYEAELIDDLMFLDPGVSNCNIKYVKIRIDPTDNRNIDLKPSFQDEEMIITHLLPFDSNLYDRLVGLCKENNFVLDARLASVALGMKLSK